MTNISCPDTNCAYFGRVFEVEGEVNSALCGGCGNAIPLAGVTVVE